MRRVLLLLFFIPAVSFAHESAAPEYSCEALLNSEFNKAPDDLHNGIVSQRVMLTVPALQAAYQRGIFPWGITLGGYGRWYRPPLRGILDFAELHIGRSDAKFIRQALAEGELRVTINQDFKQVVEQCATVPRFRSDPSTGAKIPEGGWITPEFVEAYTNLHYLGHAHSVEVWRGDKMVGGLYGVFIDGVFTGESMFYLEPDATKLAMYALIERLKAGGHRFIDTQMALGLAQKWGAKMVPRAEFEQRLKLAQAQNLNF